MIINNQKFIDGSWYDEQYNMNDSLYNIHYIKNEQPVWAKQMNQHCVDLTIAYTGILSDAKILDLGSGVGYYMNSWQYRGFDVHGIEISKIAIKASKQSNMVHGSVQDMSCFKDKQFDLVYSAAFFEHIDESIFNDVFKECCRVGVIQVHLISQDKGTDPSHINIHSAEEWAWKFYSSTTDYKIILIPNLLETGHPFIIIYPEGKKLPYQLHRYVKNYDKEGIIIMNRELYQQKERGDIDEET